MNKTAFDFYILSVNYYLNFFGIKTWSVDFKNCTDSQMNGARGQINYSVINKSVEFRFNSEYKFDGIFDINKVAFHEVLELLLCNLRSGVYMDDRIICINDNLEDMEKHNVIRTFENVLFKNIFETFYDLNSEEIKLNYIL